MRRELSGSAFTETRISLAAQQTSRDGTPPSCVASLCFALLSNMKIISCVRFELVFRVQIFTRRRSIAVAMWLMREEIWTEKIFKDDAGYFLRITKNKQRARNLKLRTRCSFLGGYKQVELDFLVEMNFCLWRSIAGCVTDETFKRAR